MSDQEPRTRFSTYSAHTFLALGVLDCHVLGDLVIDLCLETVYSNIYQSLAPIILKKDAHPDDLEFLNVAVVVISGPICSLAISSGIVNLAEMV
jgi:hypothetical protein